MIHPFKSLITFTIHPMKMIIKCLIFHSLCSFLLPNVSLGQDTFVKNEKEIVSWLKQNSMPIKHVEAGNGFSDLQPLKGVLKDVKVVGLGESTHGTREFFQVKHRMLEFLVTEMAFNTFVLEASYAACQPINDYILNGKGNPETVLTGLGYVVWDTEEVKEMIKWMREYNKKVPDEKKVKFYGVDLSNNEHGSSQILEYLKKVAPQKVSQANILFQKLKEEEAKWPMKIDSVVEKRIQRIMPELLELYSFLEDNQEKFVSSSSMVEFEQVLKYAGVIKQWIMGNSSFLRPAFVDIRSLAMAENLFYLIDHGGAQDKFVIWEHDFHLSKQDGTTGKQLHKKFGDQYYAFSLLFNEGSFHKRTMLPGKL